MRETEFQIKHNHLKMRYLTQTPFWRKPSALPHWALVLAPALMAIAIAMACWWLAPGLTLDVGASTDDRYIQGFYTREQGALGTYRWSGPRARIELPSVRGPAVLTLVMVGRPGGIPL